MSGTAIVHYLLTNSAGLTAVVPAAKIKNGIIPLGTVLPAISISKISAVQRNTVSMGEASYMVRERVQITVEHKLHATPVDILALIRAALPNQRGTVNTFAVSSIIPDSEGPRLEDLTNHIISESTDYMVSYTRTA